MNQKLFLSYKREDNADGFVEKLYKALTDKGYDVWWDMESMPQRQLNFLTEIRDAVAEHDRLMLVGSKLAYASDYVKAEFEYALSVCKPVHLILRADEYTDIPDPISQLDVPNFKDDANFDKALAHLLRHLEQDSAPLGELYGTRPALPPWYIERHNIMGELEDKVLIDSKQPVVVTSKQQVSGLHGMGGIGKTTAASAFTERCATRRYFPDGIFWITLGKNPDITFQQSNVGRVFGDDPKEYLSPERGLARLQAILSDKKVLFVLDDVWDKDHADAFRIQGDFTRTLITSRQQDLVTQVAAMSAEVDKLTIEEGLRLFDARLNRKSTARKQEAIERQIIELLDGYTLAVELASAQLFKKGEDYAERLLDRLQKKRATDNPFSDIEIEGDGKNDNLEISLAISYEDLSEDEQYRFRVLGVLAPNAPFSYTLMQALFGDEDDSVTEDNLDTLQNMALISFADVGSYSQHSVLRDYGLALLKRENEYEGNYHNYLNHITEIGWQFNELALEEWRTLDNVIPHVLYVGDTLAETYETDEKVVEVAYEFAYNTTHYVTRRLEIQRKHWLEMGLALAQQNKDAKRQSLFLVSVGYIYNALGEKQEALKLQNQALSLNKQIGDISGEATTLNNIGAIYSDLGKKQEALDYYYQALSLRKQIDDISGEATTLNNIGADYSDLGKKQEALDYYYQALSLKKQVGDISGEASTLNNMGLVYHSLGQIQEALRYYNLALPLYKEVGNKSDEAITLNNMGLIYHSLGEIQEALRYYNLALPLYKEVGDIDGEATILNNMGGVYDELGEKQEALRYYNLALPMLRQVENKSMEATTLNNIGEIYRSLGQMQEALRYYNLALPMLRKIGIISGEATILNNTGLVYIALGDKQEALRYYNLALPLYKEVGDIDGEATILNNMGGVYDELGEKQEALRYYNLALLMYRQVENKSMEATTLNNIGRAYDDLGEKEKALASYNQVLPLRKELGDKSGEAKTLNNIGVIYSALGEKEKALASYNQALPLIREGGDSFNEFIFLANTGVLYYQGGNLDEAINYMSQSVALGEKIRHPDTERCRQHLINWQEERHSRM